MKKLGHYLIRENSGLEAYDIIDLGSDQSHDGDGAKEVIASVYEFKNAVLIAELLSANS
jgi:hypothetical protein